MIFIDETKQETIYLNIDELEENKYYRRKDVPQFVYIKMNTRVIKLNHLDKSMGYYYFIVFNYITKNVEIIDLDSDCDFKFEEVDYECVLRDKKYGSNTNIY